MVERKITETIKNNDMITKGQHIVLGLSGGPDSVCLFDVLDSISKEWNLTIHPVHVNHKFRPGDAEADEEYTIKLCESRGIECRSFSVDCAKLAADLKMTSEEAGRLARYGAFSQVAAELVNQGIPKENIRIAVAQNSDDLAETVLFRIIRGTGTDGLSGISYVRKSEDGILIIRPLMDVSKKGVMEYCESKNLNPCIDKTNLEPLYSRNKIRLDLIPYLEEKYNPNIKEGLCRLAHSAAEDREFLRELAREAFGKNLLKVTEEDGKETAFLLNGEGLQALHGALRRRVFAYAFDRLGLQGDLSYVHYKAMDDILESKSPSASFDLPHGYKISRTYENVRISAPIRNKEQRILKVRIMEREEYEIYQKSQKESSCNKGGAKPAFFDYDMLKHEYGESAKDLISLRNRQGGDYINLAVGRKKIQNLFVDMKVPKAERDDIYMAAIGSEALIVYAGERGTRYSSKYKVLSCTKTVICIEI